MIRKFIHKISENSIISGYVNQQTMGQFIRYVITGFTSFGLEYSIFYISYKIIGLSEIISNSVALGIIFWFNFLMNRIWSFKSKENLKKQLIQYGCLFVFNMFMTNLLMYVFSGILLINPLISKILIMGFVVMWNFVIYKKIIYRT